MQAGAVPEVRAGCSGLSNASHTKHRNVRDAQGDVRQSPSTENHPAQAKQWLISTPIFRLNLIMSDTIGLTPEQIIQRFEKEYPDHDGLDILRTDWPERWQDWVKKGLFAEIEGWEPCTIRQGKGKGLGSEKALYVPEPTLGRLDRILVLVRDGRTAEEIKIMFGEKIPQTRRYGVWTSPWNFQVSLTRPLLLLLRSKQPHTLNPEEVYDELWGWNAAVQGAWHDIAATGLDPAKEFDTHRWARYHMPLGLWIKPPVSPEWYMSDWLSLGEQGARDVVETIRSAITKQRAHVAARPLELLERYAEAGYRVEVEPLGPKRNTTNPPRLYRLGVDPDVAMSLLKQVTAHALLIASEPERWILKCAHDGCDGFLFPDHPKKKFCLRHQR